MDVKVIEPAMGDSRYTAEEVMRAQALARKMLAVMNQDATPTDIGMLSVVMVAECGISASVASDNLSPDAALGLVGWFAKQLGESVLEAGRRNHEARRSQEEKGLS